MSVLSECLMQLLSERRSDIAQVTDGCSIERSTVYQYFTGKRYLRNRAHLEEITAFLQLSPLEQARVEDAYQIDAIGLPLFNQRKAVAALFASLKNLSETQQRKEQSFPPGAQSFKLPRQSTLCLQNEVEVHRAVFCMLKKAILRRESVDILLQPEQTELLNPILIYGMLPNLSPIRHVICMERDLESGRCANLKRLQQVLRLSVGYSAYEPLYYYGQSEEHFSQTNVFPGLLVTENTAIQISADCRCGILHTQPENVALFNHITEQVIQTAKPLSVLCGAEGILFYSKSKRFIRLTSDLCYSYLLTEKHFREYLNPKLPDYEATLSGLLAAARQANALLHSYRTTSLMDSVYVKRFIQDGIALEYPEQLRYKPFSVECRQYFVSEIVRLSRAGLNEIRLFREGQYPLDRCWQFGVSPGELLQINYLDRTHYRQVNIVEPGAATSVADYLIALCDSPCVMSKAESEQCLLQWSSNLSC